MLTIQRSALVMVLAGAVVAVPQAQTPPPDLTRTTYCTSGPFTLSGGTALFHLALDDDSSEPGGFVVMRVINQNGAVVKSKAVSLGAGASASLEYRGSGLYRVQAETFESPVFARSTRRTWVGRVELASDIPNGDGVIRHIGPGPWLQIVPVERQ